jgi:hypothetical protein
MKTVMATGENRLLLRWEKLFAEQFQTVYARTAKNTCCHFIRYGKRGHKMPQYYLYLRLISS